MTELKNRGVKDIFIACVDGLKGFPEAIETVFPDSEVQLCLVHMVRNALKFVSYKDYKKVTSDLKTIYRANTLEEAESNLEAFANKWDAQYPTISKSWRKNWSRLIPFFDYPPEIRKITYTTNAIESINMSLRKVIKNRCQFLLLILIELFKINLFKTAKGLRFGTAWAEDRAMQGCNPSAVPGPKLHAAGGIKLSCPSPLLIIVCKFGLKAINP